MAEPLSVLDPSARAALEKLADITMPQPVSFVPQTWGWLALAVAVLMLAVWGLLRWHHHREANRYRSEALAELTRIESAIDENSGGALAAIPALLKRVALAAWPRSRVAPLTQTRWVDFLHAAEGEASLAEPLAKLLDDVEYRSDKERGAISAADLRACAKTAKHWIEAHNVSA